MTELKAPAIAILSSELDFLERTGSLYYSSTPDASQNNLKAWADAGCSVFLMSTHRQKPIEVSVRIEHFDIERVIYRFDKTQQPPVPRRREAVRATQAKRQ